jgi:Zn-dependent M28 family amino/carboxypeptidase
MTYAESGSDTFIPMILAVKPEVAEAIISGQKYSPVGTDADDLDRYQTYQLENVSTTLQVTAVDEYVSSWNVVGMVEGTDPELKQQYVTVTAHLDHLEPRNGEVMNGADDNASGCAGVMEIAEAIAMNPPRRSVVFALFTKEEGGGIGSRHFVTDCPVPLENIVVNLNLDMIGRTDRASESDRGHYALNSDTITPELTEIINKVNEETIGWPLKFRMDNGGFGSDDIMFRMKEIPAVFFFSGPHVDYHTSNDDADKIEYDKAQAITQLVYELAMEFGNMDRSIRP